MRHKYFISGIILIMLKLKPTMIWAQEASTEKVLSPIQEVNRLLMDNIVILLGALVILLAFFILFQTLFAMLEVQKKQTYRELGIEWPKSAEANKDSRSLWKRINDWAWKIVPVSKESEIELDHDFDGIRELDNRLPPWWLGLMYGSIIFSAVYMYYYHWSDTDWSSAKEYEMAMMEAEEQKREFLRKSANAVDETTVALLTDEASLETGKSIFIRNCASCHGQQGEGGIGPNLTDPYWINGGSIKDIFATIKYGVPEKGMISWKSQLRPADIHKVSSFIVNLQGTNPPNGKEKEGDYYEAEATMGEVQKEADELKG